MYYAEAMLFKTNEGNQLKDTAPTDQTKEANTVKLNINSSGTAGAQAEQEVLFDSRQLLYFLNILYRISCK